MTTLRGTAYLQITKVRGSLRVVNVTQTQPSRPQPGSRLLRLNIEMPAAAFEQMIPTASLTVGEGESVAVAVESERPLFGEGDSVRTPDGSGVVVEDLGRYGVSILIDGFDDPATYRPEQVELVAKRSPE